MKLAVLSLVILAATAALAADEMKTHRVSQGPLVLSVECQGRLDAADRVKVRVVPTAFGGPLVVAEVLKEGGPVAAGEPLLRLDSAPLEEELRAARESAEQARARADDARRESQIAEDAARTRLARAEKGFAAAQQALEVFEKFEGPKMLRASELEIQGREDGLSNQKEELAQLEKMYEGTRLATETKEIVLDRTRRGVALAEAWLALAKKDRIVTTDYHHPQRERAVRDEVRFQTEELAEARAAAEIAARRKAAEVRAAEFGARQAAEKVAKLESDLERLTVRAPADGVLTPFELAPGDVVAARQPIAQVLGGARWIVRVQASADDLRVLALGTKVSVAFPEYREIAFGGRIQSIAPLGQEAKEATQFATVVTLEGTHPLLRTGIRATVRAETTLPSVLSVPRKAVHAVAGRPALHVRAADGFEVREVRLGAGNGAAVEVLAGIAAGEEVLLDAEPEAPREKPAEKGGKEKEEKITAPLGAALPLHEGSYLPSGPSRKGATPSATEPRPPPSPEDAYAKGVAFLLATQNEDGSWGSFESSRDGEIYLGTIASHAAFLEATTALCAMALEAPSRKSAPAARALARALAHMVKAPPVGRATGDTFYDVWTHAYLVTALSRLYRDNRFADERAKLEKVVRRELATLKDLQSADGGFGYYDFGHSLGTPSGHESTSFVTSVVLLALREAARAGFEVEASVAADALSCVERLRLPSGAYIYGTYAEMRPGVLFNRVKGSLGRSQPCNLALWAYGRDVTRAELAAGLANFQEHHHFIEIGKDRPRPHEAWYYTAGYYFLFGHYYAGLVIAELDAADQAKYRPWLAATLARLQDPDGSWFDFPLYGYHKPYGTAFALLGLEACLSPAEPLR